MLPPHMARVIEEVIPRLPPEIGDGSSRVLTEGVRWAALGVDWPPKTSVKLMIQLRDAAAAEASKELYQRSMAAIQKLVSKEAANPGAPDWQKDQWADVVKILGKTTAVIKPTVEKDQVVVSVGTTELTEMLLPAISKMRARAARQQPIDNMKQLIFALHNYADTNGGRFPAVANYDKQDRPLLSWRVHILPFVEQLSLYQQFHLDEPWDSEHNKKLIPLMPEIYALPGSKLNAQGKTVFLAPVGKDLAFGGIQGLRLPADFPDGTSNTILLVEGDEAHAAIWTKPDDLVVDLDHPHKGLGGHFGKGFAVGMADGSVRFIPMTIRKETLKAAFTRNGGEVLGNDW